MAIDPNFVEDLSLKGVVLHNLDRYQEAVEYLDKALAIDPNDKRVIDTKNFALNQIKNNNNWEVPNRFSTNRT